MRKYILSLSFFSILFCLQAQTEQVKTASQVMTGPGPGTIEWWQLNNGSEIDSSFALTEVCPGSPSEVLKFRDFEFDIPANAVVLGLELQMYKLTNYPDSDVEDQLVSLTYDGNTIGENKAIAGPWPVDYTQIAYGSANDNWGVNLNPEIINSESFGVDIVTTESEPWCMNAFIDAVELTVFYEFNTSDCDIDHIEGIVHCLEDGFLVEINFEHEETSDSFLLHGNGHFYGRYAYNDLPITLGPFPHGTVFNEIIATDINNDECNDDGEVEVDCSEGECEIDHIDIVNTECTQDSFWVQVDLRYENTSDSVILRGNGRIYGTFAYADFPLWLGPFPRGITFNELVAIDALFEVCRDAEEVEVDCTEGECELDHLEGVAIHCTEDSFSLEVTLEFEGSTSDSFTLFGNGNQYGVYAYTDLPVILGPFSRDMELTELGARDIVDLNCMIGAEVLIDCEGECESCQFLEAEIEFLECSGDSIFYELEFEPDHPAADRFEVFGNGHEYGVFSYTDIPVIISMPFDSGVHRDVIIRDLEDLHCMQYLEISSMRCAEECGFEDVEVSEIECTSDSTYNFLLEFDHHGTFDLGFDLWANGEFFTFYNYDDLPVTVMDFPSSGGDFDHVEICDNDNPDCCLEFEIPVPACITGLVDFESQIGFRVLSTGEEIIVLTELPGDLKVYNTAGQLLGEYDNISEQKIITTLRPGIYHMTLHTERGIAYGKAMSVK